MSQLSAAPIDVAVGILMKPNGDVLLGQRPEGKPYAGYWEFPGGKVEPGESIFNALRRQLERRRTSHRFSEPIGILTHHLVHDERTWRFLGWFLPFARVRFRWMSYPELLEARTNLTIHLVGAQPHDVAALSPVPTLSTAPRPAGIDAAGAAV